jgi:metal-responsive CopG/Arc/MetJ family transcriptional regulator
MLECICMRTTVEITDEQRLALTALAAKRGVRGFSALVREAIDQYLAEQRGEDLEAVLALRGVLSAEEGAALEQRIAQAWDTWPTAS